MHEILEKERLNRETSKIEVESSPVADKIKPGQFIILRIHKKEERIPLTFYKRDKKRGSVTVIFQKVGKGLMNWIPTRRGTNYLM